MIYVIGRDITQMMDYVQKQALTPFASLPPHLRLLGLVSVLITDRRMLPQQWRGGDALIELDGFKERADHAELRDALLQVSGKFPSLARPHELIPDMRDRSAVDAWLDAGWHGTAV